MHKIYFSSYMYVWEKIHNISFKYRVLHLKTFGPHKKCIKIGQKDNKMVVNPKEVLK